MAKTGVRVVTNGVENLYKQLLKRSTRVDAGLARDITTMFFNVQRKRWITEGASEGERWKPLASESYAAWKRKRYASAPGGGRKLLIATGTLVAAATGADTKYFSRLIERNKITFAIKVPYGVHVNEHRDFISISPGTRKKFVKRLSDWFYHGK